MVTSLTHTFQLSWRNLVILVVVLFLLIMWLQHVNKDFLENKFEKNLKHFLTPSYRWQLANGQSAGSVTKAADCQMRAMKAITKATPLKAPSAIVCTKWPAFSFHRLRLNLLTLLCVASYIDQTVRLTASVFVAFITVSTVLLST